MGQNNFNTSVFLYMISTEILLCPKANANKAGFYQNLSFLVPKLPQNVILVSSTHRAYRHYSVCAEISSLLVFSVTERGYLKQTAPVNGYCRVCPKPF